MKIDNVNLSFKQKYETGKVLEVTTRKIFDKDGVNGYIETLKSLHGNIPRYTGHLGFKRYAESVSEKIFEKYPEIKKASEEIIEISENNRYVFAKDLRALVLPVLSRFDKEIDIEI